jgi:hypothetical protein
MCSLEWFFNGNEKNGQKGGVRTNIARIKVRSLIQLSTRKMVNAWTEDSGEEGVDQRGT